MNTLPDKPSELIRVALADLKKCEEDKKYRIDMSEWHAPTHVRCAKENLDEYYCTVCLAGAVMGQTLEVPVDRYASSTSARFDENTKDKLQAINCFRVGQIRQALTLMGLSDGISPLPAFIPPNINSVQYADDKEAFYESMEFIIKLLEKANL